MGYPVQPVSRTLSLARRDRPVLGATLNRSESAGRGHRLAISKTPADVARVVRKRIRVSGCARAPHGQAYRYERCLLFDCISPARRERVQDIGLLVPETDRGSVLASFAGPPSGE